MADLDIELAIPATKADGATAESAADFDHINIYRADGANGPLQVGTVDPKIVSPLKFIDKGRPPGSYGYSTTGVDTLSRESAHSDTVAFVLDPPAPLLTAPTVVSVSVVPGT